MSRNTSHGARPVPSQLRCRGVRGGGSGKRCARVRFAAEGAASFSALPGRCCAGGREFGGSSLTCGVAGAIQACGCRCWNSGGTCGRDLRVEANI